MPTPHVLQIKVTLEHVKPPVWRRLLLSDASSFWDLHVAIQDAMGWVDCHLHQFAVRSPSTGALEAVGIPDEEFMEEVRPGWDTPVSHYLNLSSRRIRYAYDFGDGWTHSVVLEKIRPLVPDERVPACLAGRRACPPEDCGGPAGYDHLLKVLANPKHPEHRELKDWVRSDFDSEQFDPKEVEFDDPKERLRYMLR